MVDILTLLTCTVPCYLYVLVVVLTFKPTDRTSQLMLPWLTTVRFTDAPRRIILI